MKTEEKKDERAKEQAEMQLSSIREMVAALSRQTAAEAYVKDLTKTQCRKLLKGAAIGHDPNDGIGFLRELVSDNIASEVIDPDDFEFDEEEARQRIQEDALSVEVRTGWYNPGSQDAQPEEYQILLCTGGPACRIIGNLSEHGEPESATLQYQDWFTPWEEYRLDSEEEADVVKYAQQFYWGV